MATRQTLTEMTDRFKRLKGTIEEGEWIAWKIVTDNMKSPTRDHGKLQYTVGATVTDPKRPNYDVREGCGAGLNVHATSPSTLNMRFWGRIILLECRVKPEDVICIPLGAKPWKRDEHFTGGPKFRVKKLRVIASYLLQGRKLRAIKVARGYEVYGL